MMSDMKISFGEPFPHDVKVLQVTSCVYHILCTRYNNFVDIKVRFVQHFVQVCNLRYSCRSKGSPFPN